jgi:hypothetical protein
MRTTTTGILLRIAAGLLLGAVACDSGESEPEIELREGATATFKTQSSDMSFKWKGCEPPWGDDPWLSSPTEEWSNAITERMAPGMPAHVLSSWRDREGGLQCEEGCASLDMAWTGDARIGKASARVREAVAIGHCDELSIAWSVEFEVNTNIACACK